MKVLLAGATGAIGRPLLARLLAAGHAVVATTRSAERAAALRAAGVEGVVCDLLDPDAVRRTVAAARPDAVVDELTALPDDYDIRRKDLYATTNRIREAGTAALLDAARAAGASRYVVQSIAFAYAPEGDVVKDESAPLWLAAPAMLAEATRILAANERKVIDARDLDGLALRYGFFYGPGTYLAPGGSIARQVRSRRFPLVGSATGMTSFIHVDDAAAATVAALAGGAAGAYNVVDDEPAPLRDWLPRYAEAIGARPPLRVPAWLGRLAGGPLAVPISTELRGASNVKARAALDWTPQLPSWREGFAGCLDRDPDALHLA
ncbi:NAD-dependent epimerase/dehydratase family protein [Conexibacter woesei]|uniref:NAD-dependent epimerase/dehydratase n=1 Tax=Conexibacter woesei (strain DSM 14684 / CCUG 47730 / CIP 108061 / JCM 11494 / NBRC 100937 / ID131577) TaxID=469383 RepID=D3F6N4_CONWI|nr:NAD(P)-dependent oxidoreductase [Conexibacter woesei]ADB50801.1 NAD-dependent epimerase/dehydratase [Conexibacter woesei DSM 14684]